MGNKLEDVIRKVEALLTHARGTSYPGEAEAFQKKAQELMLQYQIEEASLFGTKVGDGIVRRELIIEGSYFLDKVTLLNCIAKQNFCRVLRGKGYAAVYGHNSDIELVLAMYRMLLVDMIAEMGLEYRKLREEYSPQEVNATSWKKSFFAGYAYRVGERLQEVRNQSHSNSKYALAVVNKEHEISEFWENLSKGASGGRNLSSDVGFSAGKASAGRADLGQVRINTSVKALNK